MTDWQWRVILALCRIVIDMKCDWFHLSSGDDIDLLHDAINRGEEYDKP